MLGAEFTTNDALILAVLVVLFVLLALLGVAETGINRITRHKAEALAHEHPRRGRALQRLVEEPEKFLNPVLLTVNILQTATASISTYPVQPPVRHVGCRRSVSCSTSSSCSCSPRPSPRRGLSCTASRRRWRRRGRPPGWCGSGRCA